MQLLTRTQFLPLSLQEAWEFFSSPYNLCTITPEWMGFEVCSCDGEKMYAGQIITYKVRPFSNIKLSWVTEITHVREPFFFVDEQRLGPYRFWHHQHQFEEADGGVLMHDIVHYLLPFGTVGKLLAGAQVAQRLRTIFAYRASSLAERFPAPETARSA